MIPESASIDVHRAYRAISEAHGLPWEAIYLAMTVSEQARKVDNGVAINFQELRDALQIFELMWASRK